MTTITNEQKVQNLENKFSIIIEILDKLKTIEDINNMKEFDKIRNIIYGELTKINVERNQLLTLINS